MRSPDIDGKSGIDGMTFVVHLAWSGIRDPLFYLESQVIARWGGYVMVVNGMVHWCKDVRDNSKCLAQPS